jgi:tetratricopeptide (TPR) repeat protein
MNAPQRALAVAALALLMVGAAPEGEVDDLVHRGNAAYASRQYDEAVRLYEQAEERAEDPGLVAFNKGAALYRLGRFVEAEKCYRRALEDAEAPTPRRLRALYDLGTSLLYVDSGKDAESLALAVRCLQACRRQANDPDLRARARHNLELARRLLALVVPDPSNPGQRPKNDEEPQGKRPEDQQPGPDGDPTFEKGGPDSRGQALLKDPSKGQQKAIETNEQAPGKGKLGTLPDSDELQPLDPRDTAAHLERTAERIRREQRDQRRSGMRILPHVKDW